MGIRQFTAFQNPDAIAEESKRSLRGDTGIKLAQGACRRITRVSKHFPAGTARLFVDFLKARLREEYLTAHFQTGWNIIPLQLQRDRTDGAYVGGNVFTRRTITPRRGTHQHTVFIEKADRQTIQLQLAAPGQGVAAFEAILHALVKREEALFIKDVIQRQHWDFMTYLTESTQRLRAHALRG